LPATGLPPSAYGAGELEAVAGWVVSDGVRRADEEVASVVREALGIVERGGRTDAEIAAAVRVVRATAETMVDEAEPSAGESYGAQRAAGQPPAGQPPAGQPPAGEIAANGTSVVAGSVAAQTTLPVDLDRAAEQVTEQVTEQANERTTEHRPRDGELVAADAEAARPR